MKHKISIFTNSFLENASIIELIKVFFTQKYSLIDFNIFTNSDGWENQKYAVFLDYYMHNYDGTVVFLNYQDLIQHDNLLSKDIYLYVDINDCVSQKLDRKTLNQYKLLTNNNAKIEEIQL